MYTKLKDKTNHPQNPGFFWQVRLGEAVLWLFLFVGLGLTGAAQPDSAYGPTPSASQLAWQDLEYCLFIHFGPNTFTDLEWGKGNERAEVFNPVGLNCGQWARVAKAAGARGIILTAKHHDGFCLWPSAYSHHTVRESNWRAGKGDVLKELSDSCKAYGLLFGVYLSPWDRNHPEYGSPGYNNVYIAMMKEVVKRYGPLFEFWWDGANGEGPTGKKQVYDFGRYEAFMRSVSPGTLVFSDIGPDIRWAGNEKGIAGRTNWDLLDTSGFSRGAGAPPTDTLNAGNKYGKNWIPAECDVSIRKGWFYHAQEDSTVKTPEQLFDLYLKSVGRGANLLLNVPPDQNGLFSARDSASLAGFRRLQEESFSHSLVKPENENLSIPDPAGSSKLLADGNGQTFVSLGPNYQRNFIEVRFPEPTRLNCITIQEPTSMGQRISQFQIRVETTNGVPYLITGTTVGHKRIFTFPAREAISFRLYITDSKAIPLVSEVSGYFIPENLVEKEGSR
jgi:alpha-L-fucosidase